MAKGAELPTIEQIRDMAEAFGIEMPEEDAGAYRNLMKGLRSF